MFTSKNELHKHLGNANKGRRAIRSAYQDHLTTISTGLKASFTRQKAASRILEPISTKQEPTSISLKTSTISIEKIAVFSAVIEDS